MKPIVIDVSMAVTWVLEDERTPLGDSILYEAKSLRRITTALFWYEYRNILVSNQRSRRLMESDIPALLERVERFRIEEYDLRNHARIISLALKHKLSAYDAAYLALALQEGAILATNDRRLAQAAFAEGVELRTSLERM